MKRFLLVLFFWAIAFAGRSQVILNEFNTDATSGNARQFFELYNTGTTAVPLNCYSIVTVATTNAGAISYFYVIDLPNVSIPARGFFTGGAGTSTTLNGAPVTLNFNWNAGISALAAQGASFKKWTPNAAKPLGYDTASITSTTDFLVLGAGGNIKYTVFLFDGSSAVNGNAKYVNGLITYGSNPTSSVPSTFNFATRASIPMSDPTFPVVTPSACGDYSINWSQVTASEFYQAATGNNHGYYRYANGLCGTWNKASASSNFTPGTANPVIPVGTTPNASGDITTTNENIVCNTKVSFTISSVVDPNALPLTVQLYYDNGTIGTLDNADVGQTNTITVTSVPFTGSFTILAGQAVLLVYRTALGCISQITQPKAPTAGTLTTTQVNICGSSVDFSITGATNEYATYGLPYNVQLYQNNGDVTFGAEDVAIGTPVTVTSASGTVYPIAVPEANKADQFLLVYSSANSCYNKVIAPSAPVGTLSTTQHNICGDYLAYTVTGLTGNNYNSSYLFPMTVELHLDANGDQLYDPNDPAEAEVQGSKIISGFSSTTDSIAIPDASRRYIVLYNAAQPCLSTTAAPSAATGTPTTTQTYLCGKRVDYTITGGTGDAALFSLPVEVSVFWDENGNGQLDEDTTKPKYLLGRDIIFSFSNTTHSITLDKTDQNKSVIVVYKAFHTCLSHSIVPATGSTGPVTVAGEIIIDANGNAVVNYGISSAAADAYPLELNVYEDKNRNKVLDDNEKVAIDTRQIDSDPRANASAPYPQYSVTLPNAQSAAIVTAASTTGCSSAFAAIPNSTQVGLPVTFKSFSAVRKDASKVSLIWVTASEQNNRGFHVQRNTGGAWQDVAFVFSAADNGNSTQELTYSYTDVNPTKGVSQYRILQVDLDGHGRYSEIRSVRGSAASGNLLLYPNPSETGFVTLVFGTEGAKNVVVSDVSGRMVQQYKNVVNSSLQLKNLVSGFYTVQVRDAATGTIATQKFIIKKR